MASGSMMRMSQRDGRSQSFEDIAALAAAGDDEDDEMAYGAKSSSSSWKLHRGGVPANRQSSSWARSEAPHRAPRLPGAGPAPEAPLHERFQRRLAREVEAALESAANASGGARAAPLEDLYRNITAGIEPAVASRLRASGFVGPVPARYFGLLARYYAARAEDDPGLLRRQRRLWSRLMSSDLFPAVWACLFHLWMLGGYNDLVLVEETMDHEEGDEEADEETAASAGKRGHTWDGRPAPLDDTDDVSAGEESPGSGRLRRRAGSGGVGGGSSKSSQGEQRARRGREERQAELAAAPGGTPSTRIVSDSGAPTSASSPGRAPSSGGDATASLRTRSTMELLVSGCSRLFWSDAHAGTSAFVEVFALCCDAVTSPTKLAGTPSSQRRELSSVVACHLLHFCPAGSVRRVLACLPDLETGTMPSASRAAAVDEVPATVSAGVTPVDPKATPRRYGRGGTAAVPPHTTPARRVISAASSPAWASEATGQSTMSAATEDDEASVAPSRADGPRVGDAGWTPLEGVVPPWAWQHLRGAADLVGADADAGAVWVTETAGALWASGVGVASRSGGLSDSAAAEELASRAGQFIEEVVVHLRALKRQDSTIRYISGLRGLSGVPMRRASANRLHSALHVFTTPGGPSFPSPATRAAASETIHVLFPRGWAVRRAVNLACRILNPVRAVYSCCGWTQRAVTGCAGRTVGVATSLCGAGVMLPLQLSWTAASAVIGTVEGCVGSRKRA